MSETINNENEVNLDEVVEKLDKAETTIDEINSNIDDAIKEENSEEAAEETNVIEIPHPTGRKIMISPGDPACYVYYDILTTNIGKDAQMVSIALIDHSGRTFYAEFTDFDKNKVDPSMKEYIDGLIKPALKTEEHCYRVTGDTEMIKGMLQIWLEGTQSNGRRIVQFVGDYTANTFLFLLSLLDGIRVEMKDMISPVPVDINQDIAAALTIDTEASVINYVPVAAAALIDRIEFAKGYGDIESERYVDNAAADFTKTTMPFVRTIKFIHQKMWHLA